jgi:hypothetical protein
VRFCFSFAGRYTAAATTGATDAAACIGCAAGRYAEPAAAWRAAASAAWGGPVTLSNCGGSDADNVCGAGTMTKAEAEGWNNRVWDDRPCCWDCECTGARWKVVADTSTFCGFSAWSAAGSTDKDDLPACLPPCLPPLFVLDFCIA